MFDKLIATLPRDGEALSAAVRRLVKVAEFASRVRRERRELAALEDRMLKDIGLSRSLASLEAGRDVLDLPEARLRQHLRSR